MANEENLHPPYTPIEARENGRKGGIASGKAKRRKKNMRELAEIMLNSELKGKQAKGIKSLCNDLDEDDITVLSAVIAGQIKAAIGGSTKAAEFLGNLSDLKMQDGAEEDELSRSLRELGESL